MLTILFVLYRIYFGESNTHSDDNDHNLKSCNPKLLEYEQRKQRMIVFVCDVFLDDPKVNIHITYIV